MTKINNLNRLILAKKTDIIIEKDTEFKNLGFNILCYTFNIDAYLNYLNQAVIYISCSLDPKYIYLSKKRIHCQF